MKPVEVALLRDILNPDCTLGQMYVNGVFFGYTCEDKDRYLETNPEGKIHGRTAIPRGRYRLVATASARFGRIMPLLVGVSGFTGVRIHGGNTAADTEGCPLLGSFRTDSGVANCAERNATLLAMIVASEKSGSECWLTVK